MAEELSGFPFHAAADVAQVVNNRGGTCVSCVTLLCAEFNHDETDHVRRHGACDTDDTLERTAM